MENLHNNIKVFEKIEKEYGCLDKFIKGKNESPYKIALKLSEPKSSFKLKTVGIALALEYMRNTGIDVAKPDTHIRRILGKKILGFSTKEKPNEIEAVDIIKIIAKSTEKTQLEIDYLLWSYCAEGKGEICTASHPKCEKCVIEYCERKRK
jgi:thermostable 8-oxoguanine DNA glycosylase